MCNYFFPLFQKTWGDTGGARMISGSHEDPKGETAQSKEQVLLRLGNYCNASIGVFMQAAARYTSIHLTVGASAIVNLYN